MKRLWLFLLFLLIPSVAWGWPKVDREVIGNYTYHEVIDSSKISPDECCNLYVSSPLDTSAAFNVLGARLVVIKFEATTDDTNMVYLTSYRIDTSDDGTNWFANVMTSNEYRFKTDTTGTWTVNLNTGTNKGRTWTIHPFTAAGGFPTGFSPDYFTVKWMRVIFRMPHITAMSKNSRFKATAFIFRDDEGLAIKGAW